MRALGVDLLTLSAHKLGGPPGVGALLASPDLPLQPLLRGGGQERRRRAGTENLPGIAGFGAAAQTALQDLPRLQRLVELRNNFEKQISMLAPEAKIFGAARSEEHTSELQSLMRISYAVFCLKKKKIN